MAPPRPKRDDEADEEWDEQLEDVEEMLAMEARATEDFAGGQHQRASMRDRYGNSLPEVLQPLHAIIERWQTALDGTVPVATTSAGRDELLNAMRQALKRTRALSELPATTDLVEKRRIEVALANLLWDAIITGVRSAGNTLYRRKFPLPPDVGRAALTFCSESLLPKESLASPISKPCGEEGGPPHAVLRVLAHVLSDAGGGCAPPERAMAPLIHGLVSFAAGTASRGNLRSHALVTLCLARLLEHLPSGLKGEKDGALISEALLAAAECLRETFSSFSVQRVADPSKASGPLRDALTLLQSMPHLVNALSDRLETSALSLLRCVQPCCIVSAPYVVRGGAVAGARAGGISSEAEVTEMDASSGTNASVAATASSAQQLERHRGAASLAAQCRASALKCSGMLFRTFPKEFFGRWSLVLEISGVLGGSSRNPRGASLPMLMAMCQQDPSARVRSAALDALCSLFKAPTVRSWPVPMEKRSVDRSPSPVRGPGTPRGNFLRSGSSASASSSSADTVAATLRQAHKLVGEMIESKREGDAVAALKACGDLFGCTPYSMMRPGLISDMVQRLLSYFDREAQGVQRWDSVPPYVAAATNALALALKREDCAEELSTCMYACSSAPGSVLADDVYRLALRVVSSGSTRSQLADASAPTPSSSSTAGRRSFRDRADSKWSADGNTPSSGAKAEQLEPPALHDYMVFASRVTTLRPAALAPRTREGLQKLLDDMFDYPLAVMRTRACRMLEDLSKKPTVGLAPNVESSSRTATDTDPAWSAATAHRLLAALPAEASLNTHAAALSALPWVISAASLGATGSSNLAALKPHAIAAVRAATKDTNALLRTTAVQTAGALAKLLLRVADGTEAEATRGGFLTALELVLGLVEDNMLDVRSACAAAFASFASAAAPASPFLPAAARDGTEDASGGSPSESPAGSAVVGEADLWLRCTTANMQLCLDRAEKVRSSALRASGHLAELLDLSTLPEKSKMAPAASEKPASAAASVQSQAGEAEKAPPGLAQQAKVPWQSKRVAEARANAEGRGGGKGGKGRGGGGYGAAAAAGEAVARDGTSLAISQDKPMLIQLMETLALGVNTPPPKCQWNSCRSMGQVLANTSLYRLTDEDFSEFYKITLRTLLNSIAEKSNMKVRIQAAQALQQLPVPGCVAEAAVVSARRFWQPDHGDAVISAICTALVAIDSPPGIDQPAEGGKQAAAYVRTLRGELHALAQHWARCTPEPPGAAAREKLFAANHVFERLMLLEPGSLPAPTTSDSKQEAASSRSALAAKLQEALDVAAVSRS
eukprot:TRINITY_DN50780_c0_g1_i2.p1 TRINITY_DN50780_c0_g1~~TRINITY_DN50780_c0_g1_i2.p1  ORF type:complete len:1296 (-),score=273.85 TRINITY_DN50780_c0_g1_i2:65-3952(-)